jgi:FecR protein
MARRRLVAAALFAVTALAAMPASSAEDKSLQNVKGSVSYQAPKAAVVRIATSASVTLADEDTAITGTESLAALNFPDSSQVLVGAESRVQLASFNETQVANAKFVIYVGKVRFAVRHPQGAKANYTFTTSTGTIAVRGTQGDVEYDQNGALHVNVYELCDKNNPVVITTKNGQRYTLIAGQSLVAQLVNGIVHAEVQQLTQQLINQFAPDFGVPSSWDQATGQIVAYTANAATNATGNGLAGQAVTEIGKIFGKKKTPAPSPQPTSATCNAR